MKRLWLPIFWSRIPAIKTISIELRREGRQVLSRLFQRTPGSWQYVQRVRRPSRPSGLTEDFKSFVLRAGEPA
jgi:hypothetical protein